MEEKFYCLIVSTRENETDEEITKRFDELCSTGAWAGQFIVEAFAPLEGAYAVDTIEASRDPEDGENDHDLN